jgi:abortive infection bacteriophage resistance protein
MAAKDTEILIKPPLTFKEQVELLKSRNLIIDDECFTKKVLSNINYYRLSGYSLSLRKDDKFYDGVNFDTIYQIYQFDKKLRYLLFDLVEAVEVSFRTHIAYYLAHKYGPLSYLKSIYFCNVDYHNEIILEIEKEIKKNKGKELFIVHHIGKYGGKFPVWVAVELFSFGMLSRFFNNMKKEDKDAISDEYYGIPSEYITTWLRCLVTLRNVCAHYGRLYNRLFTVNPKLSKKDKRLGIQQNKLFAYIFILKYLIKDKRRWLTFLTILQAFIEEFGVVDISLMGFPEKWTLLLE